MNTPAATPFLDKLTEKQRNTLKKEGFDRLAGRMKKICKTETEINVMSRVQMIELYAEAVLKGKGEVEEEVAAAALTAEVKPIYVMDPEVEKMKLMFEREKWAAERESLERREAAEREKWAAEREAQGLEKEAQERRETAEREKWAAEKEAQERRESEEREIKAAEIELN